MINNEQNNEQKINDQMERQVAEKQEAQVNEKKRDKGKGTFYGLIAFAIFIIMAVGATFAYFTASTTSGEGSVRTGSTTLALEYISYTTAWLSDKLIPVATNVVEYSVEKRPDSQGHKICVDDYGNAICSAYVFQVKNSALSPQSVSIKIATDMNTFSNLRAMIYDISKDTTYSETAASDDPQFATTEEQYNDENGTYVKVQDSNATALYTFEPIYINRLGVKKTLLSANGQFSTAVEVATSRTEKDDSPVLADNVEIPGTSDPNISNLKTFLVVLYIVETTENQNESDADKEFAGRIIVDGDDGTTGVTGIISATNNEELQSNTATTTTEPTTTEPTTTEPTTTEP